MSETFGIFHEYHFVNKEKFENGARRRGLVNICNFVRRCPNFRAMGCRTIRSRESSCEDVETHQREKYRFSKRSRASAMIICNVNVPIQLVSGQLRVSSSTLITEKIPNYITEILCSCSVNDIEVDSFFALLARNK